MLLLTKRIFTKGNRKQSNKAVLSNLLISENIKENLEKVQEYTSSNGTEDKFKNTLRDAFLKQMKPNKQQIKTKEGKVSIYIMHDFGMEDAKSWFKNWYESMASKKIDPTQEYNIEKMPSESSRDGLNREQIIVDNITDIVNNIDLNKQMDGLFNSIIGRKRKNKSDKGKNLAEEEQALKAAIVNFWAEIFIDPQNAIQTPIENAIREIEDERESNEGLEEGSGKQKLRNSKAPKHYQQGGITATTYNNVEIPNSKKKFTVTKFDFDINLYLEQFAETRVESGLPTDSFDIKAILQDIKEQITTNAKGFDDESKRESVKKILKDKHILNQIEEKIRESAEGYGINIRVENEELKGLKALRVSIGGCFGGKARAKSKQRRLSEFSDSSIASDEDGALGSGTAPNPNENVVYEDSVARMEEERGSDCDSLSQHTEISQIEENIEGEHQDSDQDDTVSRSLSDSQYSEMSQMGSSNQGSGVSHEEDIASVAARSSITEMRQNPRQSETDSSRVSTLSDDSVPPRELGMGSRNRKAERLRLQFALKKEARNGNSIV